ncbi:lipase secretion chaperone [uncultured Shewanella sp.]|uniref:lipase secretion chaperone n=1 Tax=uncultured Shewanella sp. TaxID=173975 RepID=UPI00260CE8D6|nr:lipase secretion chaperone [uncultured Shewanella sp.]
MISLQSISAFRYPILLIVLIVGLIFIVLNNLTSDKKVQLNSRSTQATTDNSPSDKGNTVTQNHTQQGNSLQLNRDLRWQFDEIIFSLQKTSNLTTFPTKPLTLLAQDLFLSLSARQQLFDLFSRYKDYSQAIAHIKAHGPELGEKIDLYETQNFINQINDLQSEFFNDIEIDAFFKQDSLYAEQTLERVAIRQDPNLNEQQKALLLQHQISQLNPNERNALQPSLDANKIAKHIKNANVISLDMRTETISRAQKIQNDNQQWTKKVKTYKQFIEKKSNKNNPQNVELYLNEHFTQNEVKRLKVFLANPELLK